MKQIPLARQQFFGMLALHGVTDGTHQQAVIEIGLDEIILGPFVHRLHRHGFVVQTAQNDDRKFAGMIVNTFECRHPGTVGKAHIEQHQIETFRRQLLQPGGHGFGMNQIELHPGRVVEMFAQQARIPRIVLDEQESQFFTGRRWFHNCSIQFHTQYDPATDGPVAGRLRSSARPRRRCEGKVKGGSMAGAGFHPDSPAVPFNNLLADRQPDPGARIFVAMVQALKDDKDTLEIL